MADILGIGSSGLLAYRSALNVVGQNIANANTEGYSRQRVNLEARPLSGGSVPSGNGVTVRDVQRISDQFVVNRLTGQDSSLARVNTMATQTAQLDTWLSGTDTGLSKSLQGFFDAVNGLSANASSSATRQVVLTGASALTARFLGRNFSEHPVHLTLAPIMSDQNATALTVIATLTTPTPIAATLGES